MKILIAGFFSTNNVGKVPLWYSVQEGDATMLTIAS